MKEVLVILGPTATGKTDLALDLAKKFSSKGRPAFGWNGEVVACDSRQVYKGLDIGTGKAPDKFKIENLKLKIKKENGRWIVNGVNIWMYDVVGPKLQYSVADYVKDATPVVDDIVARGKLPIVVGGTGLYLKALLDGLSNLNIPIDENLRNELQLLSLEELQKRLQNLSSEKWEMMNYSDKRNSRRLVRAIELVLGKSEGGGIEGLEKYADILKIGLTAPREVLYEKVNWRVLSRIDQGMVEEAERLQSGGLSLARMRSLGLEYGILADYLDGKIPTIAELTKIIQGRIHGYVRRQQTWFKKEKDVNWFDITEIDYRDKIEKLVAKWYHLPNDKTH